MGTYHMEGISTKMNTKMSKDTLRVNESKATTLVNDIKAQYDKIEKAYGAMSSKLKTANSKKYYTGTLLKKSKTLQKNCANRVTYTNKREADMQNKYAKDVQEAVVKSLEARIADLEKALAAMSSAD